MNNMITDMAFEESMMPRANKYYESIGCHNIKRCHWQTDGGRKNQRADIDLIMRDSDQNIVKISEKFRRKDYNDILIELSSNWSPDMEFPAPGSIQKCEADYICYWSPSQLVMIDVESLQNALRAMGLFDAPNDTLSALDKIKLANNQLVEVENIIFLSTKSYCRDRQWRNLCAIFQLNTLQELGVKLTIYPIKIYPEEYYAINR